MKRNKTRKHKYLLFLLSFAMLIGVFPMTAFAQEGEVSHLTLLTAAPIYCQSELVPLPKTGTAERSLMVFTKENEAISSYNCPQMKYSIYNGRTWTLPLTIKEDETWDMDQFLYSDEEVLVAWTEGTESFDKEETGNELASKMRISLTALDPATSKFKPVISNVSSYDTENTSTYNPRISKVGDKLLVSWVVCHNVSNDASSYGVEGLYYNPETNTFYGENNEEDASGNPVPMVFAKGCNYISTHDITKVGDQMVTLFEEENNQSHISEVLFEKIVA
ncbi:MAG: hypothetical protein RR472_03160, partial [Anaerovoracaceae bacterium]